MLARRVAAAPRAEVAALASFPAFSNRSSTRVGCSRLRSRDARRARAAPATAALMPSSATRVLPTRPIFRGLSSSRRATTRQFATPEDNDEEGSSDSGSAGGAAEAASDSENDSMPPPSTTPNATTAAQSGAAKKRTPALEARKAGRLRSQLLSMMPDPVDDPLFDAGACVCGGAGFVVSKREGGWRERDRERRERREVEKENSFFSFPFSVFPGASQVREASEKSFLSMPACFAVTPPADYFRISSRPLKQGGISGDDFLFELFEEGVGEEKVSRGSLSRVRVLLSFASGLAGGSPPFSFFPILAGRERRAWD